MTIEKIIFKVGDEVEIVGYSDSNTESPWYTGMNNTIGRIAKITEITEEGNIALNEIWYIYPPSSLKLIKRGENNV